MKKELLPQYIVGLELKKDCPWGIRQRLTKWIFFQSIQQLKRNVYLLEEDDYWIWQEYFSPLVQKYGRDFAYQVINI